MKRMIIFATLIAIYMCFGVCEAHWADQTLAEFKESNYITEDMNFTNLKEDITKGEIAQIINLYYSFEQELESANKSLELASEKGYMLNAKEDEAIRREEFAPIICELIGKGDIDMFEEVKTAFEDDKDISAWAKGYVKVLCDNQIIEGFPNHKFMPQANLKKGEFITILSRITGVGGKDDLVLIEDEEEPFLKVKTLKVYNDEIVDEEIEDELVLQSGDKALIAMYTSYEDASFKVEVKDENIAEFIEEFNQLKANSSGETQIIVTLDEHEDMMKEFKLIVE